MENERCAQLVAESFVDDPATRVQFAGISGWREQFEAHCRCKIEAYEKLGCLTTHGDDGLAIGYFTEDVSLEMLATALQDAAGPLISDTTAEDLARMQENVLNVAEIIDPLWYQRFTDKANVYVLQIIAVQKEKRGSGAFRKLIDPLLQAAGVRKAPVALQTDRQELVALYEHFGFELVEELCSQKVDLTCFNMLKQP
ncbi:MAG: GNAT family N-acetyltransferase [Gordonibacter sp.]|uniref:GNAT family N-acetyltransferase n=1 Tax=Gordonibacter sp. TaxID=1968902 RepID=UPI002FC7E2ED